MGDNNEQEAADLDALHNDGDHLFEVIYRGGRLDNIYYDDENRRPGLYPRPLGVLDYNIPADARIRLRIHSSITVIAAWACYGCTTLIEVIFHNNVTEIDVHAFTNCVNLQRIKLPAGLLCLEHAAFSDCNSLRGEIVIPASVQFISDEVFGWCTSLERVVFAPRTTSIELWIGIFCHCSDLRFVTLPQNLQSIPPLFFSECTSLTHLQIPESVEQIEEDAFRGSGIQAMNSSVGDDFMPGTIILPPNLQSISKRCFEDCKSLTHIRIPASVQRIEENALNGSDLRSIEILDTVHLIDREALGNCSSLKKVTIRSSNNLYVANNIFANCSSLSVVHMYPWLWPKLFASMDDDGDGNGGRSDDDTDDDGDDTDHQNIIIEDIIGGDSDDDSNVDDDDDGNDDDNDDVDEDEDGDAQNNNIRQPDFIFRFFRQYQTQIRDFETREVRPLRRL